VSRATPCGMPDSKGAAVGLTSTATPCGVISQYEKEYCLMAKHQQQQRV
jgi:hypothetical protein